MDRPSDSEILEAMENDNHLFFYAERPWHILGTDITKVERLSEQRFRVSVRTYETELNFEYLAPDAEIPIGGWLVECDLILDETKSVWKTDNWAENQELGLVDISALPDSSSLLELLEEVIIEVSDPDDLADIDLKQVRPSCRKLIRKNLASQ